MRLETTIVAEKELHGLDPPERPDSLSADVSDMFAGKRKELFCIYFLYVSATNSIL